MTLSPEAAAKKGAPQKEPATKGSQREVVLSFNMQEMLAATGKDGDKSPSKTVPMNIQVAVPKTKQPVKRPATRESSAASSKDSVASPKRQGDTKPTGLRSASTPSKPEDDASTSSNLRRSNRRKSSTPKWRPKDLLESPSEDEEDEEEEEENEKEEEKTEEVEVPVKRKRGRPRKNSLSLTPPAPKKSTPSRGRGRPPKIKTEPLDKPIKVRNKCHHNVVM